MNTKIKMGNDDKYLGGVEEDIILEDEDENEEEEDPDQEEDQDQDQEEDQEEDPEEEDDDDGEDNVEEDDDEADAYDAADVKKEKKKNNKKREEEEEEESSLQNYESEEDTDDEDDDDTMLQKFNDNLNTKFLEDIHVETKSVNYDEMIALSRVVRDKNGKIIDPLHKTLPFLTKYEKARIIGARAEQLDRGGEAFISLDENIINGRTIALMEFEAKKIPFIIARPLPNGSIEYWNLRDLEIL
jgi:DNA-directed RNA polymerase subunit K/omega